VAVPLLWVTGSATTPWTTPDVTDAERGQDHDACMAAAMRAQGIAPAMPAVPPLAMSPSQLDADRMSTVFTQWDREEARFASCLKAKGY
jgi:hypothetical protein